jgi:hypothetical protein
MRDFLRLDPQKWIPESGLNIKAGPELTVNGALPLFSMPA